MPLLDLPESLNREVGWLIIDLLVVPTAQQQQIRMAVLGGVVQVPRPRTAFGTSHEFCLFAEHRRIITVRPWGDHLATAD